MKHGLNYHHLAYFKSIAEQGSVSKAAELLNLGQPTLSAQLKLFEESLGVELFERKNRCLVLTEKGQLVLDYASSIFKLGSDMCEALQDRAVPSKLHVHFGALDSIPKQVLLQLTKSALLVSPCSVTVTEGRFDELIREVESHRIDLMLANYLPRGKGSRSFYHRLVAQRPVGIYGAKLFRSLRKGFPQSLEGQPFVLPTYDSQLRLDLDHWLEQNKLQVQVIAETQDTSLKKLMASQAMALIPAASFSVSRQVANGELELIGELDNLSESLFMITAERKIENPVASTLMKTFQV